MSKIRSSKELHTLPNILDHTIETTNDNLQNSYIDFEIDLSNNEISKIINQEGDNTQQEEKDILQEFFDSQENSKNIFDKSIGISKEDGSTFVKKVRFLSPQHTKSTIQLDRLANINENKNKRYEAKKDTEYQKYKSYFSRLDHQHNASRLDQQKQVGFKKN